MKQKIKYCLFVVSVFFAAIKPASAEKIPRETIVVNLSEHYLLTGESAGFSLMVSNQKDLPGKQISSLGFVELLNTSGQSVVRQKVLLKNGTGSGVISLPETLPTGNYYFVAYTSWLRNFGEENFSVTEIKVVRPGDDFSTTEINEEFKAINFVQQEAYKNLDLRLEKTFFSYREKVKLELIPGETFENAIVSLAVRKKEPAFTENGMGQPDPTHPVEQINFLPDYKGILLTGLLRNKQTGNPLPGQQVFLSFPGENVEIKHTATESDGRFRFLLEPVGGEKDLVFLTESENAGVWLDEKYSDSLNISIVSDSLVLNKHEVDFFTEKYINRQLQQKFNPREFFVDTVSDKSSAYCFYDDPLQIIRIQEYIQLDSLHEYFYELIPTVNLSRKNKKYTMRISSSDKNYNFGNNPALFVDGVYYPYPGELMNTDAAKIDRIEVIPEVYYYRNLTFDGIVSVFSKNANFMDFPLLPNMTRVFYHLAEVPKKLLLPHSKETVPSNIPDLRWLVYWNPEMKIESSNPVSVEFTTSDLKGEFEISLSGITGDGKIIRSYQTFTVE